MEKDKRVWSIDHDTPIIIPRGSNPNNPFAEDNPKKEDIRLFGIFEQILTIMVFLFLFSIPFVVAYNNKKSEEMLKSFENGATLWCKVSSDINTHIKISKSNGWVYKEQADMFINETKGISIEYNRDICQEL